MSDSIALARSIARRVHADQRDKLDRPYVEHLEHVRAAVAAAAPDDEELQVAALLHDSVEDHPDKVSLESLARDGIPAGAIELVDAVSRRDNEAYAAFIERAKRQPRSALLKRADMGHNFLPSRAAAFAAHDPERAASLAKRYSKHLRELDDALIAAGMSDALERLRAFEAAA